MTACGWRAGWLAGIVVFAGLAAALAVGQEAGRQAGCKYCWLDFGPDARVRVLVGIQGSNVTLEHFTGGKPTGRRDKSDDVAKWKPDAIEDARTKTSYRITRITLYGDPKAPHGLTVDVDIEGVVSYPQFANIGNLIETPKGAPAAHFHGPLTVQADTIQNEGKLHFPKLRRDHPNDVRVMVATGDPKKGCCAVVGRSENTRARPNVFKDVHPWADIEFPPKAPGAKPVVKRYALDVYC